MPIRQQALSGNISSSSSISNTGAANASSQDDAAGDHGGPHADVEAFTPAFQFSAFRFVEVSYSHTDASFRPPDAASLACYRIGTAFDWIGDVGGVVIFLVFAIRSKALGAYIKQAAPSISLEDDAYQSACTLCSSCDRSAFRDVRDSSASCSG